MRVVRIAVAAVALAVCAAVPLLARRSRAGSPGRLVFVSQRGQAGNFEVFAVNADGTALAQVSTTETWADVLRRRFPALFKLAGSPTPRFRSMVRDLSPAWSPDGQHVAFASNRLGNSEIFIVAADGSDQVRLTNTPRYDFYPVWSPDGLWIAYLSGRTNSRDVYLARPDGSAVTRLTASPGNYYGLAWSPDGRWLAFASDRDGSSDIFVLPAFGASDPHDAVNLTRNPAYDSAPVWSPDGTRLAFITHRDGNREVYVMNRDGSGLFNVTNHRAYDSDPTWSPDGTQLAFISYREGNPDLFVADVQAAALGSPVTINISRSTAYDGMAAWQP